jgi:hypothetical protein
MLMLCACMIVHNNRDLDEFKNIEFLKGKHGRLLACGGMNSAVVTARAWVEDSEAKGCMSCKGAFTFVNRRVCYPFVPSLVCVV